MRRSGKHREQDERKPRGASAVRRVCFVSGTRAEFGLMHKTLRAIGDHPGLELQLILTGMHLDRSRGHSAAWIKREGWRVDATVPWSDVGSGANLAAATGRAMSGIATRLNRLNSDIVLVVGDRVEAFAAAAAGHLCGRVVAHVHGGDRALGQVDDSLRHAITKLAHLHFPATLESGRRIARLGEDRRRIHVVGSPGIDGIADEACPLHETGLPLTERKFVLLVLHPADPDDRIEQRRAALVYEAVRAVKPDQLVIVYPNNDPGSEGIVRCWRKLKQSDRLLVAPNLPRRAFLGLLKHAAALVGNSSSGIIEAASFGTPVVDIGPRQLGRQRSQNVVNVPYSETRIAAELRRIWNGGNPRRRRVANVYGGSDTASRIASILSTFPLDDRARRKLIAY